MSIITLEGLRRATTLELIAMAKTLKTAVESGSAELKSPNLLAKVRRELRIRAIKEKQEEKL